MELTQCINYLLTTAQHKVFQEMSSRLEKFDVTPVQYGVMYCLWIEGKTKPKEIAAELKLENSTISGVLERMEKKELIERHRKLRGCCRWSGSCIKRERKSITESDPCDGRRSE